MRITPAALIATTTVLLLAVVTACAENADPTDPASSGKEPSTSTPASDNDIAGSNASEVVRSYYSVRDRIRQDVDIPVSDLKAVSTSVLLKADETLIANERSKRRHQVGTTDLPEVTVQSVSLDNSDPAAGKVPTVVVDVCWDVSEVDLLDNSGKSVVSPTRPDRGWTRFTVTNHHWSDHPNDGWRIASGRDLGRSPCTTN